MLGTWRNPLAVDGSVQVGRAAPNVTNGWAGVCWPLGLPSQQQLQLQPKPAVAVTAAAAANSSVRTVGLLLWRASEAEQRPARAKRCQNIPVGDACTSYRVAPT